jgi:Ca-activated chloride channel family protein
MQTLHVQNIGETEKLLVGDYDLEILTLPRTYINKVEIRQSAINKIEIPAPGVLKLNIASQGYGSIFVIQDGKQKFVCNLNPEFRQQEYALQPGKYVLTYRNKKRLRTIYTVEKGFSILSSQVYTLNL